MSPSLTSGPTWIGTFACAFATAALFYVPDAYLYAMRGVGRAFVDWQLAPVMALIGLALTLVASRFWRLLAVAFASSVQLVWVGMFVYAGIAPAPSAILLGRLQMHEVRQAVLAEPSLLYSPALVVALSTGLILILQEKIAPRHVRRVPRWGLAALLGLDVVIALLAGPLYADPDPADTSLIGGYKMAVGSARLLIEPQLIERHGPSIAYSITPLPLPQEPVTVAFILGESVSADRMSLFGTPRPTTPRLVARAQTEGPFKLFYKSGLSGGSATLGSVPNLVNMLYAANDVANARERTANLFHLADLSGFTRYLYTAQGTEIFALATDFKGFARFETGNTVGERTNVRHDDVLLELLNETPIRDRQFFFFQHRVNHFPYMNNCSHVPDVFRFDVNSGSPDERRRATYDNGILCADRAIDELLEAFSKFPGAVYVFYISDHGEMMGTGGRWGHSFTDLHVAHVPMLLFTNRPDATFQEAFSGDRMLSAFEFVSLAARALGQSVQVRGYDENTFYVNGTLPFGSGGFLQVKRTADPSLFNVGFAGPSGIVERREKVRLPKLEHSAPLPD